MSSAVIITGIICFTLAVISICNSICSVFKDKKDEEEK